MNVRLRTALAAAVLAAALAGAASAAEPFVPKFLKKAPETTDLGVFRIWSHNHAVGTETFSYVLQGDSLVIGSHFRQPLKDGDTLRKVVAMAVSAFDYDLRFYQSNFEMPGRQETRGITFGDTVFTAYREMNGRGEGLTYLKPMGRLYALESMAFVLFDVMCRNLAKREFETWTMNVFALGPVDTLVTVRARNLGEEQIRWGNAPVTARKIGFEDATTSYTAWIGPQGYMLRLEHPFTSLRVEREPPPARQAGASRRSPGS